MGLIGPLVDAVADLETEAANAGDVIPLYQAAMLKSREFAARLGVDPSHVDILSRCVTQRVFDGDSGVIRCTAFLGTPKGRDYIRNAFAHQEPNWRPGGIPFGAFGVLEEATVALGLHDEQTVRPARGRCCAFLDELLARGSVGLDCDLERLASGYDSVTEARPRVRTRVRQHDGDAEPAPPNLNLVDLFRVHAALTVGGPVGEDGDDIFDEDDEMQEAQAEGEEEDETVLQDEPPGEIVLSIEHPDPGYLWERCLHGLQRVAASTPGADARLIQPGMESWLREPCSAHDRVRFRLPPARLWDELANARCMLATIARLFKRVLALPASEAHCERVIGALRKMVCPFGFRMAEDTIRARMGAHAGD